MKKGACLVGEFAGFEGPDMERPRLVVCGQSSQPIGVAVLAHHDALAGVCPLRIVEGRVRLSQQGPASAVLHIPEDSNDTLNAGRIAIMYIFVTRFSCQRQGASADKLHVRF